MKKNIFRILLVLIFAAAMTGAWFYGYHSRQNPDNIPSKNLMVTYLQEKGETYASEKIKGYSAASLSSVWGEPDGELFGMFGLIWESGDHFFVVYFDRDSLATQIKLGER